MIDYSYCGGKDGMWVTWKILNDLVNKINDNGIIYLFAI